MSWGMLIEIVMKFFGSFIIFYMLIVILVYGAMMLFAFIQLRKRYGLNKKDIEEDYIDAMYAKPVSIIVPAYNEEIGIINNIYSLLSLHYPQVEIIVVNDGSTDETQAKVIEHFQMKPVKKVVRQHILTKPVHDIYQSEIYPYLLLVEKENGGKADALNVGINVSTYPYFCSIDGDSILEEKSLLRVMQPIILSNEEVIAAGGNIQIANGFDVRLGSVLKSNLSRNYLVTMQIVEYLRAFMMGRIALSRFNLVLIISGAFSVFSKKWVIEAGGYDKKTIGEDMELVVKLHRMIKERDLKKRIEFVSEPVCWTEAPQTFSVLRKQRRRWQQGLLESLWKHKRMTFNPRYGAIGLVSIPYFWFIECIGPIIEFGGYIYIIFAFFMGQIYYEIAILLMLLLILYGSLLSMLSVLLDAWSMKTYPRMRDILRLLVLSLSEVFWYRPFNLLWRMEGVFRFLFKKREWGNMKRAGFAKKGLEK